MSDIEIEMARKCAAVDRQLMVEMRQRQVEFDRRLMRLERENDKRFASLERALGFGADSNRSDSHNLRLRGGSGPFAH